VTWENVGLSTPGTSAVATWPGPNGQFGTTGQPNAFQDNGFLAHWYGGVSGQGYVSQMVHYLGTLGSTFNWDFATNFGPVHVVSYADADAVIASVQGNNKVGFGMESLSVEDPYTYGLGVYPTSREDWIANFTNFTNVPVHHLQMNVPGTTYLAAGYDITQVQGNTPVTGTATITCTTDCSPFYSMWVYITGNGTVGSNSFDGAWVSPCTGQGTGANQCATDILTITSSLAGTASGGIVWSPNYWPDTMVFSVNHGTTDIEAYECDLDYAFGVTTTNHVTVEGHGGGCASWGVAGPDSTYQSALSSAQ
jgi:hypothetical protein